MRHVSHADHVDGRIGADCHVPADIDLEAVDVRLSGIWQMRPLTGEECAVAEDAERIESGRRIDGFECYGVCVAVLGPRLERNVKIPRAGVAVAGRVENDGGEVFRDGPLLPVLGI